jgi:hypothetical protein
MTPELYGLLNEADRSPDSVVPYENIRPSKVPTGVALLTVSV